tara:strand:+ start:260 stop:379 length:120 start_codon:yes stop_codon:yes gene_type:complete
MLADAIWMRVKAAHQGNTVVSEDEKPQGSATASGAFEAG